MLAHPWARRALEDRGTTGPAILAYIETILAILRGGGFSVDLAHHTLHVLGSRIFGFSQDLLEEGGDDSHRSPTRSPPRRCSPAIRASRSSPRP